MGLVHDELVRMSPLIIQMRVIERQVIMGVFEDIRIVRRPEPQHRHHTSRANGGKDQRRGRQSRICADPACKRIGHQPAGVAERELRSEDGTPVDLVGGRGRSG